MAASRRRAGARACSRKLQKKRKAPAATIESRDSSNPRRHHRLLQCMGSANGCKDVARAAEEVEVLRHHCSRGAVEYLFESAKSRQAHEEHTCPEPLTVGTRESQVAQLSLIKKYTTREKSFAISSVAPSLERNEKRSCAGGVASLGVHSCVLLVK